MHWGYEVSYFFGGLFLANGVPHFVNGMSGRAFQTPFAKPPGEGLSSSTVNVIWGWFNFVAGYVLIWHIGMFDMRSAADCAAVAVGALLISVMLAKHFGKLHGGEAPRAS